MTRETRLDGSPAQITALATWLRDGLGDGATTLGDQTHTLRSQAESAWVSPAGDAFAGQVRVLADAADTQAGAATATADGVDTLATALTNAQAAMARARQTARDGGLTVSGTLIHDPMPRPPDVPALPGDATPGERAAYDQGMAAIDEYDRQVQAWNTACEIANGAERDWEQAVADLATTWDEQHNSMVSYLSSLFTGSGNVAAQLRISRWYADSADVFRQQAGVWRDIKDSYIRDGRFVGADPDDFYRATQSVDDLERAAAQAADDARFGGSRLGTNVGRGMFALGVLATGWGIYDDIQHGESGWQAAASNGGGFLAGMGAGAGTGALIGSIVPGPGTAIGAVVGTLVGAGVGIVTSGMIDSMWENGVDSLGDVGSALGDGWNELTGTVSGLGSMAGDAASAVGDGLGDAADAVGDGLSGAWNSVFG